MTSANNKRKEMSEPPVAEEKPQWALDLVENGYCVIENVMLASECEAVERDLLRYFANMGVNLRDYYSMNKAQPMHSIVQHHECGHSNAVWQVRLNSRVQDIFAQIHGTNDLLCSFDGLSYMPENLPKVDRTKSWFHMDQSFLRAPLQCVQSYVNITDASDAKTGSLCVIPGSHKFFAEFFEAFPEMRDNDDWCKIDPGPHATGAHERWFEEKTGNKATRVHGGKGSMVLWFSSTVHRNIRPIQGQQSNRRCVVYVAMEPRFLISKGDLKKKAKAFRDYRMTKHRAASAVGLFAKKPWVRSKPDSTVQPLIVDR